MPSCEANRAAADAVRSVCPDAETREVAVSDGGEGFLSAVHAAIGGVLRSVRVHDPLMRLVDARYLQKGELAVIEAAEACGLHRMRTEERNPLIASSYGVGELVTDAVQNGAKQLVIGLGGSGTSDAGRGMVEGLKELRVESEELRVVIATDVDNPLCGEYGAAAVFGPQKGATPEMVRELDERARMFASESAEKMGFDCSCEAGAGAAGGLGYAFMQYMHAERRSGVEWLLETIRFDEMARDAALIITGEGAADRQTLMGKLPLGVLKHAGGRPVVLVAGQVSDEAALLAAGFSRVECINPQGLALSEALKPEVAKANIRQTVSRIVLDFLD